MMKTVLSYDKKDQYIFATALEGQFKCPEKENRFDILNIPGNDPSTGRKMIVKYFLEKNNYTSVETCEGSCHGTGCVFLDSCKAYAKAKAEQIIRVKKGEVFEYEKEVCEGEMCSGETRE